MYVYMHAHVDVHGSHCHNDGNYNWNDRKSSACARDDVMPRLVATMHAFHTFTFRSVTCVRVP